MTATTNQSTQKQVILDDQKRFMDSSSTDKVLMEKAANQEPLKCPRCDSSNTKFCYYNNYSLSQPRHFCKACKRYWTRGGTLRNVPVGGGCRKNKRVKRPPACNDEDGVFSAVATAATTSVTVPPHVDLSSASKYINNSMFYSLPTNHHLELNFPFSGFNSTRVSSESNGFDFQPQVNDMGLGFSSGNAFNSVKQMQDAIRTSNSSLFSGGHGNNISTFFGSSSFSSTSTMASLLASGIQQQKFNSSGVNDDVSADNNFVGLMQPYEDMQLPNGNGDENQMIMGKEVKLEAENRLNWNANHIEQQQINTSDSSPLLWNSTGVGSWFDPSNMGSSVPSLI